MFDHIGSKIKTFARVICWIGIVASIVCGIVFCYTAPLMVSSRAC